MGFSFDRNWVVLCVRVSVWSGTFETRVFFPSWHQDKASLIVENPRSIEQSINLNDHHLNGMTNVVSYKPLSPALLRTFLACLFTPLRCYAAD